jgi:predicted Zn-dependent peptidase
VPKVTVAVAVRSGGLNEGTQTWLAELTTDLLKEGTAQRTAKQIAEAALQMGGEINVGVGEDETSLSLDVLSEYGADAITLLAEILTQARLPAEEWTRIQQNYLRNLSVQGSQPQSLADAAFSALLYPDHPYGRAFPTEAQLRAYSIEDARRYYENNFGAQRTRVYVAGKFDRAALQRAVTTSFGKWRAGPQLLDLPPTATAAKKVTLVDRPGAPQSTLRVGKRVIETAHPDFMALSLANTLLGGSLTSRITMNLREAKGWAYSPGSGLAARYHQTAWQENADVRVEATGPALQEIFKEIELLRTQPPSGAELTAAKNFRNGTFVISNATRSGLIGQLAFVDLHELPADWLSTWVERLYAVTPEQITAAARNYLNPADMSVVVVGDLNSVRPQLQAVDALRNDLSK